MRHPGGPDPDDRPQARHPALEPGGDLGRVLDAAKLVDRLGYDHLWTWDHLYAIFGDPYQPIFEGWSTLAAWAMATERTRLGLLVGANTFRNPGLVAKTAATLDHISGGRAILGIGGAWMELEHRAHGIEFGTGFGQRLDWLDESVGGDACASSTARSVTSPPGGRYAFDDLRHSPAAGPDAAADHDRRLRREEDPADRRPLRRHVERDGPAGADGPQGRRPPRPLRRGRPRHRRDRVHPRGQAHDPRHGGRGRPRLEGGDGPQPDADGRPRGRRRRSGTARRSRSPSGSGRTSSSASGP